MNHDVHASSLKLLLIIIGLVLRLPSSSMASPLSFSFPRFPPDNNTQGITYYGDAQTSSYDGAIDLTKPLNDSRGWAVYSRPVRLWDAATDKLINFTTDFSFVIQPLNNTYPGDGLAFFLAPNGTTMPNGTWGGTLGLFDDGANSSATPPSRHIVAVEFDTYKNLWDLTDVHIGIDVGSIVSVNSSSWPDDLLPRDQAAKVSVNATVTYDAGSTQLSARFCGEDGTIRQLTAVVDLRQELPPWVTIGFSASTGASFELHKIRSWSFYASLEQNISEHPVAAPTNDSPEAAPTPAPSPEKNHDSPEAAPTPAPSPEKNHKRWIWLLAGLMAGIGCLAVLSGVVWFILRRRKATRQGPGVELSSTNIIDDSEINELNGPKMFTNREIAHATMHFAADRKLGRGGFGEVYKGFLSDLGLEVAVKRVASDSMQGKKEYLAEINIISRLRHRNLVRLVGWCHDRGELLLVYEYLPNGSLDAHLFGRGGVKSPLLITWPTRYKIAQGLASALLYLREGFEQCVVHRDVKPSNVMLDADFNPKLGDFGLARLVDHGLRMQTTVPAGTWGYVAPECAIGGKASKESDVYSFGVVALEIACGRRALDPTAEEAGKVSSLVEWVWGLYGQHALLDATDERLPCSDVDAAQVERLMEVGLWCAHPDLHWRPPMRQVVAALNFETIPPSLPRQMPVLRYVDPATSDWQSDKGQCSWRLASSSSSAGVSSVMENRSTAGSNAAGVLRD